MIGTSRRELLRSGGVLAAGAAIPAVLGRVASAAPLEPLVAGTGELPTRDDISHLVSRITFGLRPQDYEEAARIGYEAYLDRQLEFQSIDDGGVEELLLSRLPTLSMSLEELVERSRDDRETLFQAFREFEFATIYRAVYSPRQLFELMVEFWGNHFAVFALDGPLRLFKAYEDRAVMRRLALDRFPALLQADARSPAMLYYLDNIFNVKGGPNENYARELLELHTLGVDGGYTEKDVQEVARVFTGWGLERGTGDFRFYPFRHDYGSKEVLGVHFRAGRGEREGDDLLDFLAGHHSTATFVAAKLARRFVSDDPPQSVIDQVAETFNTTGGDIRATLRTLFLSDGFVAAKDGKLKRPFDYVVSVLRATAPQISQQGYRELFETLRRMGQIPYGWPAPDGYPDTAPYWISTSALLDRWSFAFGLADGTSERMYRLRVAPLLGFATTPVEIVDTISERVLGRPLAVSDRETMIDFAADGRRPDGWLPVRERVKQARAVLGLILSSRYFQLR